MPITTINLIALIQSAGSVSVDADNHTTQDLQSMAIALGNQGATLTVRNANIKTTSDLISIARIAPGKVLFEF